MIRRSATVLLLMTLWGCGAEEAPRLSDAGPPEAEPPSGRDWKPNDRGALVVAKGRQSFEGRTLSRCVTHDRNGLQINLRTGDQDLPAMVVRVEDFHGEGPYRGKLFLTGRSRTGALVSSTGTVSLEVEQTAGATAANGALLLRGSFEGSYDGPAGKGSVQGKFGGCTFALPGGLMAAPAPTATTAVGP